MSGNIPKVIHQIWYQGEPPEKYQKNIKSWRTQNPEFDYRLWNEYDMKIMLPSKYLKIWNEYPYMHQRIDFFKYYLMHKIGGVYADMDSVCLQPLSTLLKNRNGILVSHMKESGVLPYLTMGTANPLNNGIFASSKGHPFWEWYMSRICKKGCNPSWSKYWTIQNTTGPKYFSICLKMYKNKSNDIDFLPYDVFEPCYGLDPYCKPSKTSYSNHIHEQTWISSFWLPIVKGFFYIRPFLFLFLFIFLLGTSIIHRYPKFLYDWILS